MASKRTRREELLEVAIDLFAANGYAGTSIRDIANVTGHSVSNVYHYFENKEALWLAILEHSVKGLPDKLRTAAQGPGDPVTRFRSLLRIHLEESVKHHRESKIFHIDEERLSPQGKQINRQLQKEILDVYLEQLSALQNDGVIKSSSLRILAFNILGVINWHLRWQGRIRDMPAQAVYDEIIDFILGGIGVERTGRFKRAARRA